MDIKHLFSISFLLIGLIFYFVLKQYYSKKSELSTSHYSDIITINNNEDLNNTILSALKNAQFDEVSFDYKQNKFFAITKKTMSSFGEYLIIDKINMYESKVKLNFRSQCNYPFQIYAWGKNKKNYNRFQSELLKLIV